MEEKLPKFRDFIAEVLAEGYDWAVDLYFPSPTKGSDDPKLLKLWENPKFTEQGREAIDKWRSKRSRCVKHWLAEIMLHAGQGGDDGYRYINVLEEREDFSSSNHILLGGCSLIGLNDRNWKQRWHEMSGGTTYDRVLDDRIGGLLNYFVMTVGCTIELGVADSSGLYQRSDFFQWKPREQWLEENR